MTQWTQSTIRSAYLQFFKERHNHAIIPGASLVPENDPTVLFTTAGMHPLVPYLTGQVHPSGNRLVDVQRCVRTQDIDEVGDNTHLTMFEMLGNWSLGDYFKEGSIAMSYEFLTEVLGIEPNMLSVTCFAGDSDAPKDEEAAGYWMKHGIPADRIGFLGKKDNWWGPAGLTGPCGPDTEIFYWIGEGEPYGNPSVNDSDWMEIWNNVFMQYNKQANGTFEPLAKQNVDTGMGLERITAVMHARAHGLNPKSINVYQIDSMARILQFVSKQSTSNTTDADAVRRNRIITDHTKAAVFMIADGIEPSNTDQGYVLRRLIRRAIRNARQNSCVCEGEFCSTIAKKVIAEYGDFYDYLHQKAEHICAVLTKEEKQFSSTLTAGLKQFEKIALGTTVISGTDAFHLYDTYGFPLEITKDLALERGLTVDTTGFEAAFAEHQAKSRAGAEQKFKGGLADNSAETTKLHTATHLLNAALRTVLGTHVEQRGSNITAERLRFDFCHNDKMTDEQKTEVEQLVNAAINADAPIYYELMSVAEAKAAGAIGVFDDRYEAEVKVYTMGPDATGTVYSKEICGGPHVARTGMLGSFTLQKEESSSAGVRRIKAIVSGGPADITAAEQK